jgi:MarR-like DNA-binding transcriptional regulator SgrR of sgrS sRNA
MRPFGLRWLAASSLLLVTVAGAATRPRYGGVLHVAVRVATLDPLEAGQPSGPAASNLLLLVYDTLVMLDDRGVPQPGLALSWQADASKQRWQFVLRRGVAFREGAPFTADLAAASLRAANPTWKVSSNGSAVVLQLDSPEPHLPAQLALARNAIVKRESGKILGTGPFVVTQWQAGKNLTLTARDDYWGGRPFVDSIEVELGKSFREQRMALDLKKSQLIELAPEQTRQVSDDHPVEASAPVELVALLFRRDPQSPVEAQLRHALALSIDRNTINRVLLQEAGEPSGSLLPNWMTGYGFLFPADADVARARQLRSEVLQPISWTLGYDANDPLTRILAERITLNARDAGLSMQLSNAPAVDLRVVRVPLESLDAHTALARVSAALGLSVKTSGDSPEDLYRAESAVLQSWRVVPLLHLRVAYGLGASVRNWNGKPDGSWDIPDLWLGADKP